jgi:hypothetical protein
MVLTTPPAKKRVYVHTSKNPTEAAARHPRQMKISFRALILAPQRTVGYGWEARVMKVKTKKGTRVVQVCSNGLPETHVGVKGYEYPKLQKPSRTRNMGIVIQFLGAALESTNVCGDMSGRTDKMTAVKLALTKLDKTELWWVMRQECRG